MEGDETSRRREKWRLAKRVQRQRLRENINADRIDRRREKWRIAKRIQRQRLRNAQEENARCVDGISDIGQCSNTPSQLINEKKIRQREQWRIVKRRQRLKLRNAEIESVANISQANTHNTEEMQIRIQGDNDQSNVLGKRLRIGETHCRASTKRRRLNISRRIRSRRGRVQKRLRSENAPQSLGENQSDILRIHIPRMQTFLDAEKAHQSSEEHEVDVNRDQSSGENQGNVEQIHIPQGYRRSRQNRVQNCLLSENAPKSSEESQGDVLRFYVPRRRRRSRRSRAQNLLGTKNAPPSEEHEVNIDRVQSSEENQDNVGQIHIPQRHRGSGRSRVQNLLGSENAPQSVEENQGDVQRIHIPQRRRRSIRSRAQNFHGVENAPRSSVDVGRVHIPRRRRRSSRSWMQNFLIMENMRQSSQENEGENTPQSLEENQGDVEQTHIPQSNFEQIHIPQGRRLSRERRVQNCARRFLDSPNFRSLDLREPFICHHCGAKLFAFESRIFCCGNGGIRLPFVTAPNELMQLYVDQTEEGRHFRHHIRAYNHIFSFTSIGVRVDEQLANGRHGIYTFRAQGAVYHKIGSLLPVNGERPRYLQMYIYDTEHEVDNRLLENELLHRSIVERIKEILDHYNPFVCVFRQLAQRPDLHICKLIIKEKRSEFREYNLPTSSQVAAIIVGGDDPDELMQRDIIVQTRSGQLKNVPDTKGYYDPLQYPLLHPHGSYGWDSNMRSQLSCRAYYCYILQIRECNQSLFLHAGRLLQQYIVDMYVKIETQRLRYIRDNQDVLRAELYQGLQDSLNAGEINAGNVGRRTILPASFIGSPRDKHNRYQDAMALVQKYGKPDLFITMTCNPTWDEIVEELLPGQQAQDRPDLTTRVFRAKYEELKKDIFERGVLGNVISHVHVIEFQKRGLPHCHMLVILHGHYKLNIPTEYDEVVRAEIPQRELEPGLYNAVLKHMVHGPCGTLNPRSPCMKNGCCKKRYPKEFAPFTLQGINSYPTYQRRDDGRSVLLNNNYLIDNRWVVPYNPWLLRKYDCHINVEICSSILSIKYLYKYVNKGNDRVSLEIRASDNHDEIRQHVDACWVCPQEAFWKIFRFPLNKIYPSVIALQIHLPNKQHVTYYSHELISDVLADDCNSRTMLTEFFRTNQHDHEARQLLYREFPESYRWLKSGRYRHWQKRITRMRVVGRIYTVSPFEGDRYYLRVLLNHVRGPTSFDDLLMVDNIKYPTFKQAAEERGLLERDNSIRECLFEAATTKMPSALRRLFVVILVYCEPVEVRKLWDEFKEYMSEDYPSSSRTSPSSIHNRLLLDLEKLLLQYDRHTTDYDLPELAEDSTGIDKSRIIREEKTIPIPSEDLNSVSNLNADQMYAFNIIMKAVDEDKSSVFFIDGPGGTGKTYLYRAILAYLRNHGHIAIAIATSGISSTILPGGRTAHSKFKIPINATSTSMCSISKQSDIAELLRQTSVHMG